MNYIVFGKKEEENHYITLYMNTHEITSHTQTPNNPLLASPCPLQVLLDA